MLLLSQNLKSRDLDIRTSITLKQNFLYVINRRKTTKHYEQSVLLLWASSLNICEPDSNNGKTGTFFCNLTNKVKGKFMLF